MSWKDIPDEGLQGEAKEERREQETEETEEQERERQHEEDLRIGRKFVNFLAGLAMLTLSGVKVGEIAGVGPVIGTVFFIAVDVFLILLFVLFVERQPRGIKPNLRRIGDLLFKEALEYGKLNPIVVGTHTSYLIHDDGEELEGRWISIHFRENLAQLSEIKSWREQGKAFLRTIEKDLHLLARELKEGSLRDIKMIIGLTGLSASWGKRHGFTTIFYTDDKNLIRIHNDSIVDNPNGEKDKLNPLHLFFFPPQGFIDEFYKENLPRA